MNNIARVGLSRGEREHRQRGSILFEIVVPNVNDLADEFLAAMKMVRKVIRAPFQRLTKPVSRLTDQHGHPRLAAHFTNAQRFRFADFDALQDGVRLLSRLPQRSAPSSSRILSDTPSQRSAIHSECVELRNCTTADRPYGWSIVPPVRCATIFLAF